VHELEDIYEPPLVGNILDACEFKLRTFSVYSVLLGVLKGSSSEHDVKRWRCAGFEHTRGRMGGFLDLHSMDSGYHMLTARFGQGLVGIFGLTKESPRTALIARMRGTWADT
jgi:hypothetical protein